MTNRYDTSQLPEDQYEPGSNGTVLRNLLGIASKQEMEHVEEERFERLMGNSGASIHNSNLPRSLDCDPFWKLAPQPDTTITPAIINTSPQSLTRIIYALDNYCRKR